jgi:hypothetical protein
LEPGFLVPRVKEEIRKGHGRTSRLAMRLLVSGLLASALIALGAAPSEAAGLTSVRVGSTELLGSDTGPFLVPIFIRHGGGASFLHIGLDYDELMLQFNDSWSVSGALGREPWSVDHDPDQGHLDLFVPFDPRDGGASEEVLLIQLEFQMRGPGAEAPYGYRASARILVDRADTFLVSTANGAPFKPQVVTDGKVTVYLRDAIELGSLRLSPDRQEFRVPVYVTHLQPDGGIFRMGLDYDELFLSFVGVEPASPLVDPRKIQFDDKGDGHEAWVEAGFTKGVFPRLLREHLLDLVFSYREEAGVPSDGVLEVSPSPPNRAAAGEGGASIVEVRDGLIFVTGPQFIRGDADGSGSVEIDDALYVLAYVSGFPYDGGGPPDPACLDALDSDANGAIGVGDAIQILNFLFLGGPPPATPFPMAGSYGADQPRLGCPKTAPWVEPLPPSDL